MKEAFTEYYLKHENPDATQEEIDKEWAIIEQDLHEYGEFIEGNSTEIECKCPTCTCQDKKAS